MAGLDMIGSWGDPQTVVKTLAAVDRLIATVDGLKTALVGYKVTVTIEIEKPQPSVPAISA
jgi:hypothetical protein